MNDPWGALQASAAMVAARISEVAARVAEMSSDDRIRAVGSDGGYHEFRADDMLEALGERARKVAPSLIEARLALLEWRLDRLEQATPQDATPQDAP